MVEIPEDEVTEQDLAQWYIADLELKKFKERLKPIAYKEKTLRDRIFRGFFKQPKEGTNNHLLTDGSTLKGVQPWKRDVDEGALEAMKSKFRDENLPVDSLFEYQPKLNKKVYNTLTEEQKQLVDRVLIIKEESVQLTVVPAKPKEE